MHSEFTNLNQNQNHNQNHDKQGIAIRGILFDLDNTLVATEAVAARALESILSRFAVTLSPDEERWMIGRRWDDIFDRVFVPRNLSISRMELAHRVIAEKDRMLEQNLPVLPGALEALHSLARDYPLGIVSGSFRDEIDTVLSFMGAQSLFSCMVGSEDVTQGKPHPEPYLLGAERLSLKPSEILVFEDSEPGVTSARAAGCWCIGVLAGGTEAELLSRAHRIIATLENVTADYISEFERTFLPS